MTYSCSRCGSENTQKLSVMFGSGTSTKAATSVGAGMVGGHVGIAVATTKGKTQSLLAQQYGPPQKQNAAKDIGCLVVFGLFVAVTLSVWTGSDAVGWVAVIGVAAVGLALQWQAQEYNSTTYQDNYQRWDRRYLCLRCENIFQVGDPPSDGATMVVPKNNASNMYGLQKPVVITILVLLGITIFAAIEVPQGNKDNPNTEATEDQNTNQLTTPASPENSQPPIQISPQQPIVVPEAPEAIIPERPPQYAKTAPKPVYQAEAFRPSFDCAKAGTAVERLICANKELSDLDVRMAGLYDEGLARAADKNEFQGEQKMWRDGRDLCPDATCLSNAYNGRIKELQRWVGP